MLQVISLPRNALCEHWSPMGGMDAMHQECHGLLSVGLPGGTVRHLVLPQVAKKKLHLISLLFPEWKAGELLPSGLLLPFLWKAGNCTRFGNQPSPTHSNLAAKFRPFLSQAESGSSTSMAAGLCLSFVSHTAKPTSLPLHLPLRHGSTIFAGTLFFFFFIHPEVKNPSWNGKFQLKQILNVAKSQAHGNRTQKRGCWTSLTPHSTSSSTSKAYFDPLWNRTQFHKQQLCKPLCIYYLQKPQPFNGSILSAIWIQLQNRHPKSLGQPEEKEMGKPRPLWAQSNFASFGGASPTPLIADSQNVFVAGCCPEIPLSPQVWTFIPPIFFYRSKSVTWSKSSHLQTSLLRARSNTVIQRCHKYMF